jgi:rhodanese-related sulfurtransferase
VTFFLEHWYIVLTAIVSGALLLWPSISRSGGSGRVSASEAVMLINREKAVLIDVSEPGEYASSHASPACNIPFGQLEGSKDLPSNKALPVVLMCPTGARAGRAVTLLKKRGYEKASAVIGGLAAWREAQLPVEKSAG